MTYQSRRTLLKKLGLSAAAAPFVLGLPSFAATERGGEVTRVLKLAITPPHVLKHVIEDGRLTPVPPDEAFEKP